MEVYLPKVHKDGNPMRLDLSTIGSPNHMIAKVLNKPFVENEYTCKDMFNFTREINDLQCNNSDYMVSFDVKSLFTNVPLNETIEICVRKFSQWYGESNCLLFKKLRKDVH